MSAAVSILVPVDVALKLRGETETVYSTEVSILVPVDVALKPAWHNLMFQLEMGFNPCSRGCCSETREAFVVGDDQPLFQSLFPWMLP